ncbi:MAG: HemY protein [Gammaproteobacteria bacterium]|jgi:HemY protein
MVSLAIAVLLGHFISDDAGFVVIGYGGKVFRTSFVFFLVLLVLGWATLYYAWRILYRFLTIKTRLQGWTGEYRAKRSKRALANGLIALAEGNFTRAEQLLSRGADDELAPAIHYLGAAEAAQAQNAVDRRDNYLSLARAAMPSAEVAIGIKRAQMQLANNQVEQSRATLEYLADRHPDNKQILALQQQAYQEVGDSGALLRLLPALRRHRVFDADRMAVLERETATQLLSRNFPSLDELDETWNGLPKVARSLAPCLALYCRQLVALGHHEEAEKLLRKSLTRQWHPDTVCEYGEVRIHNAALQLERAESWLVSRAEDVDLILALAKLSVAADSWTKAREYVDQLIALAPSPIAYHLLAEVHEQANEADDAGLARRKGLALATQPARALAVLPA